MKRNYWRFPHSRFTVKPSRLGDAYPTPGRQARFGGRAFRAPVPQRRPQTLTRHLAIDRISAPVPTLTIAQIKMQFFDRQIYAKAEAAEFKVMNRTGAFCRKVMRRSMRYSTGRLRKLKGGPRKGQMVRVHTPSVAPAPPKARKPHPYIRQFTFYWYEKLTASVVCGPAYLPSKSRKTTHTVPEIHDKGGILRHTFGSRRNRRTRSARYPARPFSIPARNKTMPKFHGWWADAFHK